MRHESNPLCCHNCITDVNVIHHISAYKLLSPVSETPVIENS